MYEFIEYILVSELKCKKVSVFLILKMWTLSLSLKKYMKIGKKNNMIGEICFNYIFIIFQELLTLFGSLFKFKAIN